METIKSDNELIAEFMGWERYSQNSFKCPNTYPIDNSIRNGWTTFSADQLEFGSDWRWLMPVVEKIENGLKRKHEVITHNELYLPSSTIEYRTIIRDAGDSVRFEMPMCHTRIESVYKACLEYIKWYNQKSLTS